MYCNFSSSDLFPSWQIIFVHLTQILHGGVCLDGLTYPSFSCGRPETGLRMCHGAAGAGEGGGHKSSDGAARAGRRRSNPRTDFAQSSSPLVETSWPPSSLSDSQPKQVTFSLISSYWDKRKPSSIRRRPKYKRTVFAIEKWHCNWSSHRRVYSKKKKKKVAEHHYSYI